MDTEQLQAFVLDYFIQFGLAGASPTIQTQLGTDLTLGLDISKNSIQCYVIAMNI